MVVAVLNKSKEKLYNPIDCIITENEGKKTQSIEWNIPPSKICYDRYTIRNNINVRQFVYIMTGVNLKKQKARIFYCPLLANKTGTIN